MQTLYITAVLCGPGEKPSITNTVGSLQLLNPRDFARITNEALDVDDFLHVHFGAVAKEILRRVRLAQIPLVEVPSKPPVKVMPRRPASGGPALAVVLEQAKSA